jgi:signal transduction histidine kinase
MVEWAGTPPNLSAEPRSERIETQNLFGRRLALLIFGAWTLLGVLIAGEVVIGYRLSGQEFPVGDALIWYLAWTYTWALFTPVILWLQRRFPFRRGRWASTIVLHFVASLLIAWIGSLVFNFTGQALGHVEGGTGVLLRESLSMFVAFLHFDPLFYWIIIGLAYLTEHYQTSRARELRASQLETQLAEARLQALEAQLHPHFLFNALNTIAVLVRTERSAQAVRVVTGLGELLRRALDGAGAQVVPLKQEIEFIRRYLEIEQIRFGERLEVELCIEPRTQDAQVPYLILQPLVENAIQHGIASRTSAGKLRIDARRDDSRLQLSVQDDGPGLSEDMDGTSGNGVGLSTTKERLQRLYGDDHDFVVENAEDGGVIARLDLPFSLAVDELGGEV